MTQADIQKLT